MIIIIVRKPALSEHKPLIDHRMQGGHDAFLANLEKVGIPCGGFKKLEGDGVMRVRRDTGLNKGIQHLPMGGESKLRVIRELPFILVDYRWCLAESCSPFTTTG